MSLEFEAPEAFSQDRAYLIAYEPHSVMPVRGAAGHAAGLDPPTRLPTSPQPLACPSACPPAPPLIAQLGMMLFSRYCRDMLPPGLHEARIMASTAMVRGCLWGGSLTQVLVRKWQPWAAILLVWLASGRGFLSLPSCRPPTCSDPRPQLWAAISRNLLWWMGEAGGRAHVKPPLTPFVALPDLIDLYSCR